MSDKYRDMMKPYKDLSRDELMDVVRDLLDSLALTEIVMNQPKSDLTYSNSMSFSPTAIREDVSEIMDNYDKDSEQYQAFKWALQASDNELNAVASFILSDDDLWNTYRSSLVNGLVEFVCQAK